MILVLDVCTEADAAHLFATGLVFHSEETIVLGPTDTIHDGFLTFPHTYAISVIPTVIPISGSQINKRTQPHQPRNKHRPVFEKGIVNVLHQW
jgi:hypothetical protein